MYPSSTLAQVRGRRLVAEYQECIRAIIPTRPCRLVPLAVAEGRVLAADVIARSALC
jgi:molybdopterin biosynthesis enzyme